MGFTVPITLEKIKNRDITVGVIGLGYVGLPLALLFAEGGVRVLGFDVDDAKIEKISASKSYIHHIGDEQIAQAVNKGLFHATSNMVRVSECDAVCICVPTPLTHHLEPDLSFVTSTCEAIAPHIAPYTLISLESTTWPGTTDEVVLPILQSRSKLKLGIDLYVCFSPEREDPGNSSFGTKNTPKLVGGLNQESLELAATLYEVACQNVVRVKDGRVAESSKLLENIFRSVNIALVNELKVIFDKMGIDVWEVIQAAATKPFGYMPFWPGPGLGGHCIPIDPFYLSWKAKEHGVPTRFIELAGEINRRMPEWVMGKVQDCLNNVGRPVKGARILILGLAYKANVADIRESPSLELIELLQEKGAVVEYSDPFVIEIPKTREYGDLKGKRSQPITAAFDCFVMATAHTQFQAEEILKLGIPIVDTRNHFPKHPLVTKA
jgi:UDP-N-acetyl-D-glucosamine dehydrogenase